MKTEEKLFLYASIVLMMLAIGYDVYKDSKCKALSGVMVRGICLKGVQVIE